MRAHQNLAHAAFVPSCACAEVFLTSAPIEERAQSTTCHRKQGAFAISFMRSSRSINERELERKQRTDEPLLKRYRSICPLVATCACTALSVSMGTWSALRSIVVGLEWTKLYLATTAAP